MQVGSTSAGDFSALGKGWEAGGSALRGVAASEAMGAGCWDARLEEEEEERQNVMVRGVTNGGLSHGNPHDNKQTYT